jgi:hypothetical protein
MNAMAWDIQFDDLFFVEVSSFETTVRAELAACLIFPTNLDPR